MHAINSELFRRVKDSYDSAYTAHSSGLLSTEEFYKVKQVFGAAKKHLLPSSTKAMSQIEKDLQAKYGEKYSRP